MCHPPLKSSQEVWPSPFGAHFHCWPSPLRPQPSPAKKNVPSLNTPHEQKVVYLWVDIWSFLHLPARCNDIKLILVQQKFWGSFPSVTYRTNFNWFDFMWHVTGTKIAQMFVLLEPKKYHYAWEDVAAVCPRVMSPLPFFFLYGSVWVQVVILSLLSVLSTGMAAICVLYNTRFLLLLHQHVY